jgi:hypothetical protein
MLTNILGFGILAAVGLKYRRRPEVHRPFMLLATLFVAGPAGLFRITAVNAVVMGAVNGILATWIPMLTLGALLVLMKWLLTRSWDRYFATGFAAIVIACWVQVVVANSAWWNHIAGWVTA